jgi:FtsX-like permease family
MRAVVFLAAHELRVRWRGWTGLVLLVVLVGGAVLAAAAGALRTASSYPRLLTASKASDVLVAPDVTGLGGYFDALARLPGAGTVAPVAGMRLGVLGHDGLGSGASAVLTPVDGRYGRLVDVPKVLAGRLPAAGNAGEIVVDQRTAARTGLQVGSMLTMRAVPVPSPAMAGAAGEGPARPRLLHERVVGVVVTRGSVLPVNQLDKDPVIMASPALFRWLGVRYMGFNGAYVQLRQGTSAAAFARRAQALARRFPATGGHVFVAVEGTQAATVQRAIRPQAVALALFALALAVTALLIVGQAATRLLATGSLNHPALAALGLTRGQLMAAGLIEVGAAAVIGAMVAAGVAVAASPLMPIGPARLAEPDPGVSADAIVLAAGTAALVVLLVTLAAWPAWRLASTGASGSDRPAALGRRSLWTARLAGGAGLPVTAAAGVRLALEPGRGRTAVPVRAALAGTALSVLAVTAALTFGANLVQLVNTQPLYGQRWDAAIDLSPLTPAAAKERLGHIPGIAGWTFGHAGAVEIGGQLIPAVGLTAGQGPLLSPTVLQGRPPRTADEIVLGTATLRQIGRHVGQPVTVSVNGHPVHQRIVGRAVFPDIGGGSFTPTDLGQGAETTADLLKSQAGFDFVLVSFTPGPRRAANIASFQQTMTRFCLRTQNATCVVTDQRPNGVTNFASIDATPMVLAALLAVIGVAVLGQFIMVSARRRRRDFAIFKTLGMSRRQIRSVTAWQVSTLTGLALLAGLPLGIAAGRWSWAIFAHGLGIPDAAITPIGPVLLMVPAVIAVANAVAFWPGRATARLRPAEVLHAE